MRKPFTFTITIEERELLRKEFEHNIGSSKGLGAIIRNYVKEKSNYKIGYDKLGLVELVYNKKDSK